MPQGSSAVRPTNGLYLYLLKYDIRVKICSSSLRKGINGGGGRFVRIVKLRFSCRRILDSHSGRLTCSEKSASINLIVSSVCLHTDLNNFETRISLASARKGTRFSRLPLSHNLETIYFFYCLRISDTSALTRNNT